MVRNGKMYTNVCIFIIIHVVRLFEKYRGFQQDSCMYTRTILTIPYYNHMCMDDFYAEKNYGDD